MKCKIKSILFCVIASVLSLCGESIADDSFLCPKDCFCLNNGRSAQSGYKDANSSEIIGNIWYSGKCREHAGYVSDKSSYPKSYQNITVALKPGGYGVKADYYVEDFSEFYESELGFYGIKDGEFIYGYKANYFDMLPCPVTHPNSERGSSSLSQCFKYNENGDKVYYHSANYGSCNIDGLKATIQNLQKALAKAAQELQDALDAAGVADTSLNIQTNSNIIDVAPVKMLKSKVWRR